jgi:hypothetical protein
MRVEEKEYGSALLYPIGYRRVLLGDCGNPGVEFVQVLDFCNLKKFKKSLEFSKFTMPYRP